MKARRLFLSDDVHTKTAPRRIDFENPSKSSVEVTPSNIVKSISNLLELTLEETKEKRAVAMELLKLYSPEESETEAINDNSTAKTPPLATLSSFANGVTPTPWDKKAFYNKKNGEGQKNPVNSAKSAKNHAIDKVQSVYDKVGMAREKLAVLEGLLLRKSNADVASGLVQRMLSKEQSVALQCFDQFKSLVKVAQKKKTNDSETFMRTMFMAIAPDKEGETVKSAASMNKMARVIGIPLSSFKRRMSKAVLAREKLLGDEKLPFIQRHVRNFPSVYTRAFVQSLHDFILNKSNNVVRSPNANHTINVKDPATGIVSKQQKCFYRESIHELHMEILERFEQAKDGNGNIILGETTLRRLLPKQLSKLTDSQKQTCGCEGCIVPKSMTTCLIAFRSNTLRNLQEGVNRAPPGPIRERRQQILDEYKAEAFPNGQRLWNSAREAVNSMTCAHVGGDIHLHRTICALDRCKDCPALPIPKLERDESELCSRRISFHVYKVHHRCSLHGPMFITRQEVIDPLKKNKRKKHELVCTSCVELKNDPNYDPKTKSGKIVSKKWLTLRREPIGTFFKKHYIPEMVDYRYHCHQMALLGKHHCNSDRQKAFQKLPGSVLTQRDYADHLEADFNSAIQSEHFGDSVTVSMEGCTIRFIDSNKDSQTMHYYACLSDDKRQDARTTFVNTETVIKALQQLDGQNLLARKGSTVYEIMDGCTKQYRSGNACYLMSVLAAKLQLTFDRMIQAPGHGKGDCDSQGGVDKTWVKHFFLTIFSPERTQEDIEKNDRYGIDAHVVTVDGKKVSFAELVAAILSDPRRNQGLQGSTKYRKREQNATISLRRYFAMHHGNTDTEGNSAVPLINTTYRCHEDDLPSTKGEKHNGLMGHYHIVASHHLGVGRVAMRRFPCSCDACFEQINKKWILNVPPKQQPRFENVTHCKYKKVFGDLNSWKIVRVVKDEQEYNDDEIQAIFEDVFQELESATSTLIEEGNYGAYQTDDDSTAGYYIIQFKDGGAFALQEDTEVQGCGIMKAGTLVCRAIYWNPVHSAKLWFTPPTVVTANHTKLFRVRYIANTNIELIPMAANNKLPNGLDKKLKQRCNVLGAKKVSTQSHEETIYEIAVRALIDFYEGDCEQDDDDQANDDQQQQEERDEDDETDDDSSVEVIPAKKDRRQR